jgi:hypothetical protein
VSSVSAVFRFVFLFNMFNGCQRRPLSIPCSTLPEKPQDEFVHCLAELGLGHYVTTFVQNQIYTLEDAALLSPDDFDELGVP